MREKTKDQLDLQALHRVRSRLVSRRTATINQIRALLHRARHRGQGGIEGPAQLSPRNFEEPAGFIRKPFVTDRFFQQNVGSSRTKQLDHCRAILVTEANKPQTASFLYWSLPSAIMPAEKNRVLPGRFENEAHPQL